MESLIPTFPLAAMVLIIKILVITSDQRDVRANRDTFVQNSASNEDCVDTTPSTAAHTSYWV